MLPIKIQMFKNLLSGSNPGKGWTSRRTLSVFNEGCLLLTNVVTWAQTDHFKTQHCIVCFLPRQRLTRAPQSGYRYGQRTCLKVNWEWKSVHFPTEFWPGIMFLGNCRAKPVYSVYPRLSRISVPPWMFSQGARFAMPFWTRISLAQGMVLQMGSLSISGFISSMPIFASWLIASESVSRLTPTFLFLFNRSDNLIMLYFS